MGRTIRTNVPGRLTAGIAACLCLAAATLAVYWQVADYEFVNFDDDAHVYQNQHVVTGLTAENLRWAFGIHGPSQWHPLAWISHQLDCELFGLQAGRHHAVSLGIHLATAVLLYFALIQLTDASGKSLFVALLFALHPLNVESVAWVAERRNVLCGFFWMLTLLAYVWYAKRPSGMRYAVVAVLSAASLAAKPMAVTLPFVLLLLDWYPLQRMGSLDASSPEGGSGAVSARALILEKIPLLCLSVLSSVLTVLCQQSVRTVASVEAVPVTLRLANAAASYGIYLSRIFWPRDLAVFYPHPAFFSEQPLSQLAIPAIAGTAVVLLVTVLAVALRHRRPLVLVGWLWFLGVLVPMIGLVQVGRQQMADRYTYLASIGVFIALAWLLPDAKATSRPLRFAVRGVAAVFVLAAAAVAWHQTQFWESSITLFQRAAAVTEGNSWAENNLGLAYQQRRQYAVAMQHFQQALQIDPDYALAHYNVGRLWQETGSSSKAISSLQRAIETHPDFAAAHSQLATTLASLGQLEDALPHFARAAELQPATAEAQLNLAIALGRTGRTAAARQQFSRAVELAPDNADAHFGLAIGAAEAGDDQTAETHLLRTIELRPHSDDAWTELGKLRLQQGNHTRAAAHFRTALSFNPGNKAAQTGLDRISQAED